VGITLALQDVQSGPGGEREAEQIWAGQFTDFLPALDGDDFIGVQNYSRILVGPDGMTSAADTEAEVTQLGYEFYPQALGNVLRRVAGQTRLPLFVTENGIATADDTRRTEFIRLALAGVERALADGIDVRGYFYWSALDNFEWMLGYRPTFGIIAVDRDTQRRTVKDSARYLGGIARGNALP
jgi:beta-glucosidase